MNELFIIKDYDTHKAIYYYLTNSASKCVEILSDLEHERFEAENNGCYDTINPLEQFEKRCELLGIRVERITEIKDYYY